MKLEDIERIMKGWHCGCHVHDDLDENGGGINPRELFPKLLAVAKAAKYTQAWFQSDHDIDCCCDLCDPESLLDKALKELEEDSQS